MANESYVNGSVSVGTTATVSVPAATLVHIPSVGGYVHDLYAIVGTGTSTVTYLFPGV